MPGGIEVGPGVEAGIAGLHRHGVEDPVALAGFGVVRLEEPGRVEVVARSDEHVIVDDDWRHRREVLLVEVGDLDVPALLAGLDVERHEVIVRRLEEEVVAPDGRAAIADVRAALRLPVVAPQLAAVARVDRPDVVGRGHIENAVHLQDGALDLRGAAGRELTSAFAADNDRRRDAAASTATSAKTASTATAGGRRITGGQPGRPRQREILDGGLIHLLQRAVPSAGVVARIGGPRVGERFANRGGIEPALSLAGEKRGRQQHGCGGGNRRRKDHSFDHHFSVTR